MNVAEVAVIGDELRLGGFALAGAEVHDAPDAAAALAAWEALPEDVSLLVLDAEAARALADRFPERPELLRVEMPS